MDGIADPPRFCGDIWATEAFSLSSKLAFEKSSLLRTGAAVEGALGIGTESRVGDDCGPSEGCLRAGDPRKVLIGDFERGGGSRTFDLFRSAMTSVGSAIVPVSNLIAISCFFVHQAATYFLQHPYPPR